MILEKDLGRHSGISRGGRAKTSIPLNFGAEGFNWYFPSSIFQMETALTYTPLATERRKKKNTTLILH